MNACNWLIHENNPHVLTNNAEIHENNTHVFANNAQLHENNTHMFANNKEIHENNTYMFANNHYIHENNAHVLVNNEEMHENTTHMFAKNATKRPHNAFYKPHYNNSTSRLAYCVGIEMVLCMANPRNMTHQHFQECIDACLECAIECEHCATACLQENEVHMLSKCILVDRDCADICMLTARMLARGSQHGLHLMKECAEICDRCAEECEKHSHMEHCQQCAEACRRCAEECHSMAGQMM